MHFHCEVIMPSVKDIKKGLEQIMKPLSENESSIGFWDWYVMGGRFAGAKEICTYKEDKLELFYKKLKEMKLTVSGIQSGKQEINPKSQISIVDDLWNSIFPTENGEKVPCPLFAHSNNQYDSNDLISCDICRVEEIPEDLSCSRVIIAGLGYESDELEATFMICEDEWNGVNFIPIKWDGKVQSVLKMFSENIKNSSKKYRERTMPRSNWLCITVDYHC